MKSRPASLFTAIVLVTAQSAIAAPEPPTPRDIERFQAVLKSYRALLARDVSCSGTNPCLVIVPVTVIPFEVTPGNKVDYCLAEFPKTITFGGTNPTASAKRIVWKVQPTTLTAASGKTYRFEFQKDNGILLASNPNGQITGGGWGDGGGGPANKAWYFRGNKHRVPGTALYLPVVLQTNTADPLDVGVCATGDPRIVNN